MAYLLLRLVKKIRIDFLSIQLDIHILVDHWLQHNFQHYNNQYRLYCIRDHQDLVLEPLLLFFHSGHLLDLVCRCILEDLSQRHLSCLCRYHHPSKKVEGTLQRHSSLIDRRKYKEQSLNKLFHIIFEKLNYYLRNIKISYK